jgi:hypothetical protein
MVDATSDSGRCGVPEETSIVINPLNDYGKRICLRSIFRSLQMLGADMYELLILRFQSLKHGRWLTWTSHPENQNSEKARDV